MSTAHDPYVKWLGIRDPQRPPNHYRLLGLELFEADPDVIESAADRQMTHVRSFQNGPQAELTQRILNELAAAKLCLLDPARRAAYESAIRAQLPATEPPPIPAPSASRAQSSATAPRVAPAPTIAVGDSIIAARVRRKRSIAPILLSVLLLGGAAGAWYLNQTGVIELPFGKEIGLKDPAKGGDATKVDGSNKNGLGTSDLGKSGPASGGSKSASSGTPPAESTGPAAKPKLRPKPDPRRGRPDTADVDVPQTESKPSSSGGPDMPKLPDRKPRPKAKPDDREPPSFEDILKAKKLVPPPTGKELAAAKARVREVFGDQLAKSKKPNERRKLAEDLFGRGSNTIDNLDDRYALLETSLTIAEEVGEYRGALQVIDEMARRHAVPIAELKVHAFIQTASQTKVPSDCVLAARAGFDLANQIAGENDLDSCDKLARFLSQLALRARDAALVQEAKELTSQFTAQRKIMQEYEAAVEKLKTTPDDPASNFAVGMYLATARDDLIGALRYFIKSGDEKLKEIALREEGPPTDADPAAALADSWRTWSQSKKPEVRVFALRRAKYWYDFAAATGTGLKKAKAEKDADETGRQITALISKT